MKNRLLSFIAVFALLFLVWGTAAHGNTVNPVSDKQASVACRVDRIECHADVLGERREINAGQVGNLPTTLPRLPRATVTVTIRPPRVTIRPPAQPAVTVRPPPVTIRPPAVTVRPPARTIRPPAVTVRPPAVTVRPPRATVTETERVFGPGRDRTVTRPRATVTVTERGRTIVNNPRPTATVTERETVRAPAPLLGPSEAPEIVQPETQEPPAERSEAPGRQEGGERGTMRTETPPEPQDSPNIEFPGFELSIPEVAGIGVLGLITLAGIGMLGLWAGYYLGYKDSDRKNAKFLAALRERLTR